MVIVLFVFLCITGLDFVVNSILYSYGLSFSLGWYIPYMVGLSVTIFSISGLVMWQSYTDIKDLGVAFKRGSIIFLAHFGGLIDCLYFMVYNGGKVHSGEWTWMWQYWLFGTWNWNLQLIWSFSFLLIILSIWKINTSIVYDQVLAFLHIKRVK